MEIVSKKCVCILINFSYYKVTNSHPVYSVHYITTTTHAFSCMFL